MKFHLFKFPVILIFLPTFTYGADVDYLRDIKPMFLDKCVSCHGPVKQEAGLRLDAAKFLSREEELEPVAIGGHPEKSLIVERVSASIDERMPPEGEGEALTPKQLKLLREWIRLEMPAPEDEEPLPTPDEHWAYQKIISPEVPNAEDGKGTHPVDRFLSQMQSEQKLYAVDRANPETLLRRVSFDVIGLPPDIKQLESFAENPSQEAYESVVSQLLESPRYGERWGRHWMDVWRYSDWNGYKQAVRGSQRHIWHWRDWIIESLNEDKSYDRMIVEMLAGDEVAPLDPETLRATGFLARNFHNSNRNIWLDATVEHTAKAFLGMTINCARCHDHKFDPIAQQEYYTFRAIFEPHNVRTDRLPGQANITKDGIARVFDKELAVETFLYKRGDEKHPNKENPLTAGVVEILGLPFEVHPVELPVKGFFPALSEQIENEDIERLEAVEKKAAATLRMFELPQKQAPGLGILEPPAPALPEQLSGEQQLAIVKYVAAKSKLSALHARYSADRARYLPAVKKDQTELNQLMKTAAKAERLANWTAARSSSFQKWQTFDSAKSSDEKNAGKKKAAIVKAQKELATSRTETEKRRIELSKTDAKYKSVGAVHPKQSTGRRLALANWIVHPDNPLTARVAVNHIWLRHFGTPLVDNVFDFGMRSPQPVHHNLLDWLASELIESGWKMKHIHRLILTSQAYQQASTGSEELHTHNNSIDPDNYYYWRANVQRLESEIIRDSVLHVANQLDMTMSGPDIDFSEGENILRRSVYFRHAYEKQMLMMTIFDAASPNECYRRSPSIIPQQALALSNSQLSFSAARSLAAEINKTHSEPQAFINQSFLTLLNRQPSHGETSACQQFLQSQAELLSKQNDLTKVEGNVKTKVEPAADPTLRACENLIHVLMNHNDFTSVR